MAKMTVSTKGKRTKVVLPPTDRYGLPVAATPTYLTSWERFSAQVVGGLPKPEPMTTDRIYALIEEVENQWAELTAEMAEHDARLARKDRWLDNPANRLAPGVGEAFQRRHATSYTIQGVWAAITERLGMILGCVASLPESDKTRYAERYQDRLALIREQAVIDGKPFISPALTFSTLSPTLWAIARCEAVLAGCTSKEAIKPPLNRTGLMDDVARQLAKQIREINWFNGYALEDEAA